VLLGCILNKKPLALIFGILLTLNAVVWALIWKVGLPLAFREIDSDFPIGDLIKITIWPVAAVVAGVALIVIAIAMWHKYRPAAASAVPAGAAKAPARPSAPAKPAAPAVAAPAAAAPAVPAGWVCPNCGAQAEAKSLFCVECGTRRPGQQPEEPPRKNVCAACGAPMEEGQRFCSVCGTKREE